VSDTTSEDGGSFTGFNVTPGPSSLVDDFIFFLLAVIVGNVVWEIVKYLAIEFNREV
jgi:hypothetical protein